MRAHQAARAVTCALAVAALLLAALPLAAAGTREDPDVVSPGERPNPAADLRAAWLEYDERGVRMSVQVTSASRAAADHLYFVHFRVAGHAVFAAVGFTANGELRSYLGPPTGGDWNVGGFDAVANDKLLDAWFTAGTPATLSAIIPWDSTIGLTPGATLIDIGAGTTIFHRVGARAGTWEGGYDSARSDRVLVMAPQATAAGSSALAWMAALAPVGAAAAFLLAWPRRPRAAAQPPPAPERPGVQKPRVVLDPREASPDLREG